MNRVHFSNFPISLKEDQIKDFFSKWGEITEISLKRDKKTKISYGMGWVEFKTNDPIPKLLKEAPSYEDKKITIQEWVEPPQDSSGKPGSSGAQKPDLGNKNSFQNQNRGGGGGVAPMRRGGSRGS
jgi:heterogeneous nuclear ribonucleoprotein A1/A3